MSFAVRGVAKRLRLNVSRAMSTMAEGKYDDPEKVYDSVQNYYGKVLSTSKDLKTSACTTLNSPHPIVRNALAKVPSEIKDKYYGCGTPLPLGIQGLHLLDLGSGSGQDCYIASQFVGAEGSVTGVDMTDEQLEVARKHVDAYTMDTLGYAKANLEFKKGYIEFLDKAGIKDSSMDMVISNCVINLSPDKPRVIEGVYNALREGGELYFSDVYCDRRLPENVRTHDVLLGECLGGALYIEDFVRICNNVGFTDPRELAREEIIVHDPELKELCGNARFYSITYRCFKLESLESLCEDFGQVAVYNGSIDGHNNGYALDDHHFFEKNRPMLVCGNTAAMVEETWLKPHFTVTGDRSCHFGLFDCAPPSAPSAATAAPSSGGACC